MGPLITHPAMKPDVCHYDVLEVSPHACAAVIKAAYRCLAQSNHPDKNPNDPTAARKLASLNVAYAVLGDPVKRARYDADRVPLRRLPSHERRQPTLERRRQSDKVSTSDLPNRQSPPGVRPFAFRPLG